ncbi:hypothetical protein [Necropsobacter massiliensis]|uniref:hypothetical protein n=1 Tax=Necropsobacter massiliensis TaxID=1400001 RepID=UPI000ADE7663|nr:hypothetical protein [Necropsobacter massiliensis]
MAAEKLTKKRLIQILLMLCILLSAFIYHTCRYDSTAVPKTAVESAVENTQITEK